MVSAVEQPEVEIKTEPQESPIKAEPKVVERPEPVVEQKREAEKPVVVSSSNVVSSSVSPEIPAEPVQVPQKSKPRQSSNCGSNRSRASR